MDGYWAPGAAKEQTLLIHLWHQRQYQYGMLDANHVLACQGDFFFSFFFFFWRWLFFFLVFFWKGQLSFARLGFKKGNLDAYHVVSLEGRFFFFFFFFFLAMAVLRISFLLEESTLSSSAQL